MDAYSLRISIGNKLTDIRKAIGLSQGGAATRLEISNDTLSNYETGKRDISFLMAIKATELYEVPITALVPDGIKNKTADEEWLVSEYRKLTDEEKKMVSKIIKGLLALKTK